MVDYVKQLYDQAKSEGVTVEAQDFDKLRETATTKYNALQAAAQPIMKVIEDPEAVAKLKGGVDKEKNLDLLRSEYNVGFVSLSASLTCTDLGRADQRALPLRPVPVLARCLRRGCQPPLPLPHLLRLGRPEHVRALGQARV